MPILTPLPTSPLPTHLPSPPSALPLHPSLPSKSLSFFFSFVFLVNQIYGPGVLAIPIVFQQSGLIPTSLFLLLFMLVSSLSSTLLSQSIALIPGNCHYERRFEFSSAVAHYWGRRAHLVSSVLLNVTIQSYNLASIVICAQSIDQAIVELFGRTFAIALYPQPAFAVLDQAAFDLLTTGTFSLSVTLGYVVIVALFLPTCFQNLDDNVKTVQLCSFLCFVAILTEFTAYFLYVGHKPVKEGGGFHSFGVVGSTYTQLVSVFIFSWSYTMFVPSWLNEKRDDVSVNSVVWSAGGLAMAGYLAFGILCASVEANIVLDNILPMLTQTATLITRIFAHAFALTIIAPGIPVCSVSTRNNLLATKAFSRRSAYFLSAVAPFLLSFLFSSGAFFAQLLVWSSLLFNGVVNFLIPMALYITAIRAWEKRRRRKRREAREKAARERQTGAWIVVESRHQEKPVKDWDEEEQKEDDAEEEAEQAGRPEEAEEDGEDEREEGSAAVPSHQSSTDIQTPLSLTTGRTSLTTPFLLTPSSSSSLTPSCSFHLPSSTSRHYPVYPFGRRRWLKRHAVVITACCFCCTAALILAQIVTDLYYLIGLHENLLA